MSTLKTINIIHPSGSTNNIVSDASGNITVGNNATIAGTLTATGAASSSSTSSATAFIPTGSSAPTNGVYLPAANTVSLATASTERFRFGASGQFGIGGATYGTSGQVLTSGGASAAPTWTTPSASFASTTAWASVARTSGTTYTNSLSYPIMFLVTGGLNGTLTVVVNGVTILNLTAAYSNYEYCSPIIPSGATYSYTSSVTATGLFILS